MSSLPPDDGELEKRISALLRAQPPRRAPAALAARVLAAVERRHVPWWQRSFGEWPLPARIAFFGLSLSVAALALVGTPLLTAALEPLLNWVAPALHLTRTAYATTLLVLHLIPQSWLEGAAAFAAILYLATFALGATAYRALYGRHLDHA
jgi:hypothetical protein